MLIMAYRNHNKLYTSSIKFVNICLPTKHTVLSFFSTSFSTTRKNINKTFSSSSSSSSSSNPTVDNLPPFTSSSTFASWNNPPRTHFYGNLDAAIRTSAGFKPSPVEVPYVDQVRAEHLLKLRFHVGHHKRSMARAVSGQLYGFRHNISIFDVAKSWKSLRTIFYAFAEMAHLRSSFFLLAPNSSLPMQKLVERMRKTYPFRYNRFSSMYMLGYADQKYIDGTFSNWKQTYAFYEHVQRVLKSKPNLAKFRRLQRYLRGIDSVDLMARIVPDFILVFSMDRGAAHEAANLDVPLVGMVDSNTSPLPFLYPVFGNDDSVQSIAFMMDLLGRAVEEGRKREHEAFANVMLSKIKARLAAGVPVAPTREEDFDTPDADEAALEAKLREVASSSILARRDRVAAEADMRRQPGSRTGFLPDAMDIEPTQDKLLAELRKSFAGAGGSLGSLAKSVQESRSIKKSNFGIDAGAFNKTS
jgi:small subunit ribosomal protein S2